MQTNRSAVNILHRCLFHALIEMRNQGHEKKDSVVFHLADLFHNIVLEMENAAEGKISYDDVLSIFRQRVKEKKLERWMDSVLLRIDESTLQDSLKG